MDKSGLWRRAGRVLLLSVAISSILPAQTFTTLASFTGTNGLEPSASLVQGADGNLYGTAEAGGANGAGTVFKMSLSGVITTLYSFQENDGASPAASSVQATDGNFYGTTSAGGTNGSGTIFKITSGGALTTLQSFNSADGAHPEAGLVQSADGNLYGTTSSGGANGYGTVFKMTPSGELTTLYGFASTDGATPRANLIQAADGSLYGTASKGGVQGYGTVFRITTGGVLTTLYNFSGPDGSHPYTGLIQASDGNFYGTTYYGGFIGESTGQGGGTVFKMTPAGVLTTLYKFCTDGDCTDGQYPDGSLIQGSDGNLYGTTNQGGAVTQQYANGTFYVSAGTIFKITLGGVLTTLHSFAYTDSEGGYPAGSLIQASDGNFYGTTQYGGSYIWYGQGGGTIFRLGSTPLPQSNGVVNAASFQPGIVPNSWIAILGTNLSTETDTWTNAVVAGELPTSLDGVSVSVAGQPAYISYVSPTQINALAPNVGAGIVSVSVTNSTGTSEAVTTVAQLFQPAFFQWGSYAVATRLDYSLAVKNGTFSGVTTVPAKPGELIVLWGTGFGPTTPAAPVGVEVPSGTTYNTTYTVRVTVGDIETPTYGAALTPGCGGLYQVAIQIPASLADGDYPVIATISGATSPASTLISVQR